MRRLSGISVLMIALTLAACAPVASRSELTATSGVRTTQVAVEHTESYDSISELLADTKVAVIATAQVIGRDPSSRSHSLVRMKVSSDLRGSPGGHIVVSEEAGQPGDAVDGLIPLKVGHTYLLLLGAETKTGRFTVLGGVTGLFSYDASDQAVSRLDPAATFIPQSFSLGLAESMLGTPPPPTTTTTAAPPLPGTCPPGCSLSSDYDAITVLASSATEVEIVTVTAQSSAGAGSPASPHVVTDQVLQADFHVLAISPVAEGELPQLLVDWTRTQLTVGQSYLVFLSFNRGGSCISALFAYDRGSQTADLIGSDDGLNNQILLPGRTLPIPRSISLSSLQERMYPTTGVLYPTDTGESFCPGP
jgi:hypothetical protein